MAIQPIETPASHTIFLSPLLIPLIATTIGLVLFYWYQQSRHLVRLGNLMPGPPTLPIIGNAHYVIGKTHNGM